MDFVQCSLENGSQNSGLLMENRGQIKAFIQETLASERDELRKKIEAVIDARNDELAFDRYIDRESLQQRHTELKILRVRLASLDSQDKPTN